MGRALFGRNCGGELIRQSWRVFELIQQVFELMRQKLPAEYYVSICVYGVFSFVSACSVHQMTTASSHDVSFVSVISSNATMSHSCTHRFLRSTPTYSPNCPWFDFRVWSNEHMSHNCTPSLGHFYCDQMNTCRVITLRLIYLISSCHRLLLQAPDI